MWMAVLWQKMGLYWRDELVELVVSLVWLSLIRLAL